MWPAKLVSVIDEKWRKATTYLKHTYMQIHAHMHGWGRYWGRIYVAQASLNLLCTKDGLDLRTLQSLPPRAGKGCFTLLKVIIWFEMKRKTFPALAIVFCHVTIYPGVAFIFRKCWVVHAVTELSQLDSVLHTFFFAICFCFQDCFSAIALTILEVNP